jgi:hypothetical protein
VWLLDKLADSAKKQALHDKQPRRILKSLQEIALIEGVESSNRIDGVTVEPERSRSQSSSKPAEAQNVSS